MVSQPSPAVRSATARPIPFEAPVISIFISELSYTFHGDCGITFGRVSIAQATDFLSGGSMGLPEFCNSPKINVQIMFIRVLLSTLGAYLIGALIPGYLIRGYNDNTGENGISSRNPSHSAAGLFILPLLRTSAAAAVDAAIAAGVLLVCRQILDMPTCWLFLPAAAMIMGDRLSLYRLILSREQAGRIFGTGIAPAAGMYLYLIVCEILSGGFPPLSLLIISGVGLVIGMITFSRVATGLVVSLFMTIQTPIEMGLTLDAALCTALSAFMLAIFIFDTARIRLFKPREGVEFKLWRVVLRPFAFLFVPIGIQWGKEVLVILIGAVAGIFIVTDIVRIFTGKSLGSIKGLADMYRKRERRRFSSMTLFLTALFIIFLVFPRDIAYMSLVYLTVGDLFGKMIGRQFGRHRLYRQKTLEGTLAFFAGSVMTGYIFHSLLPIPILYVLAGSAFAAIVELLTDRANDNFTVGILSSGFLYALRFFLTRIP